MGGLLVVGEIVTVCVWLQDAPWPLAGDARCVVQLGLTHRIERCSFGVRVASTAARFTCRHLQWLSGCTRNMLTRFLASVAHAVFTPYVAHVRRVIYRRAG